MKPERLTHYLDIQRSTATVKPSGGTAVEWCTLGGVWAELIDGRKVEEQVERGTISTETLTFRGRYVRGVALSDRVFHAGKTFNIVEISDVNPRAGSMIIKIRRTGP